MVLKLINRLIYGVFVVPQTQSPFIIMMCMHAVITVFLLYTTDLFSTLHTPWFSDFQ